MNQNHVTILTAIPYNRFITIEEVFEASGKVCKPSTLRSYTLVRMLNMGLLEKSRGRPSRYKRRHERTIKAKVKVEKNCDTMRRTCLSCSSAFMSEGKHNRICLRCKEIISRTE